MVVGQPTRTTPLLKKVSPPAHDFLIFTIITMIVCGIFGGGIGALITIPALIFSLLVSQ